MRNRGLVLAAVSLLVTIGFGVASASANAATLWDQMTKFGGADAQISVNDFTSGPPPADTEGADDFVVPAGTTWTINSIDTFGLYTGSSRATTANVRIYADSSGVPGGFLAGQTNAPLTSGTGADLSVSISPIDIAPGHYWMSVQPNTPVGSGGWAWWTAASQIGSPGHWRDPSNSFGRGCVTFTPIQSCSTAGQKGPDFAMRINGSIKSYALNYTKTGSGTGNVTSSPGGINSGTSQSANFAPNAVVDLTFSTTDSVLTGWTGCDTVLNNGKTCRVTMSSARNVSANIELGSGIIFKRTGAGSGGVTSDPPLIDCAIGDATCGASTLYRFARGSTVTLRAATGTNSAFTGWTGCTSSVRNVCTVVTRSDGGNLNVSANFVDGRTLVVNKNGAGDGTVTSVPDNVNCPVGDCLGGTAFHFPTGTSVQVSAVAAKGSAFDGWERCEQVDGTTCTMVASSDKSLIVNFDSDGDGDGVGDKSDLCPNTPGVADNSGCPRGTKPPDPTDPGNAACDKAKAKLAKAKAKLKKLKAGDASAKQVKGAKAKVKKAKAKVKKVC